MKRLIAVLLAVFMVASLCTVFSFAEEENLVFGLDDGVTGYQANGSSYNADLTDGNATTEVKYDDSWFAFYHNQDANGQAYDYINAPDKVGTVVFDLGEVCTVSKVRVNTFLGNTSGIVPPASLVASYSVDGETYSEIASKSFSAPESGDTTVSWVELEAGSAVACRYVKLTVNLGGVFAFLNEIEVMGTKGGDPSKNPEPEVSETTSSDDTDSEATSSEETSSDATPSEATSSETESKTESTDSTAESSNAPAGDEEPANLTWLWIVIAVVVVAAVVVLAVTAKKKK